MKSNAQVFKRQTQDGFELDAILFSPAKKTDTVILHFHGKEGDFLQNHFIQTMAENFPKENIAFMTASHRGRSYIVDLMRKSASGFEYIQMGSAFDIFEDCVYDIDVWVNLAYEQGFKKIYLQQHSTPQKIVWYYYQKKPGIVKGLILISPSDFAYSFEAYVEDYEKNLSLSKKLLDCGKGRNLMPVTLWSNCPVSAATFYNWGKVDSNFHLFNYSHPERGFKYFEEISLPMIAIFPENDFSVGKPTDQCLSLLKKHSKSKNFSTQIISHAHHSFLDHEEELVRSIKDWVQKIKYVSG
ncbi:hypothetical protein A2960_01335 [Candidatus Gottesmanbacteria bacterium RIFCSPLOWO2_01_FULL_39_12b]|uniref:Alpha/beta hydrolase n=1 Tax=Candidatus Gottesmanbacteria bacterium RIFCSPLOWO2_01_FULL_39_12b TaxID=1798388 RepID=A0A1F6AQ31_9BACT|nr:MAG: hypothetical protein A2960_01335 [Candidatus Gottesmanbacteria bacterium RIFCSPLOWO2_01_FULL_39_12b]